MRIHHRAAVLLLAAATLAACSEKSPPPKAAPPEVTVVTVQPKNLRYFYEQVGQAAGFRETEVRSRVAGILLKRLYREGQEVKEGDPLFQIDPEPYKAALDQAKGALRQQEAAVERTKNDRERIEPLFKENAVSRKDYDDAALGVRVGVRGRRLRARQGEGSGAEPRLHARHGADRGHREQGDAQRRQPRGHLGGREPAHHHRPARPAVRELLLLGVREARLRGRDQGGAHGRPVHEARRGAREARRRPRLLRRRARRFRRQPRRPQDRHHPRPRRVPQPEGRDPAGPVRRASRSTWAPSRTRSPCPSAPSRSSRPRAWSSS